MQRSVHVLARDAPTSGPRSRSILYASWQRPGRGVLYEKDMKKRNLEAQQSNCDIPCALCTHVFETIRRVAARKNLAAAPDPSSCTFCSVCARAFTWLDVLNVVPTLRVYSMMLRSARCLLKEWFSFGTACQQRWPSVQPQATGTASSLPPRCPADPPACRGLSDTVIVSQSKTERGRRPLWVLPDFVIQPLGWQTASGRGATTAAADPGARAFARLSAPASPPPPPPLLPT